MSEYVCVLMRGTKKKKKKKGESKRVKEGFSNGKG